MTMNGNPSQRLAALEALEARQRAASDSRQRAWLSSLSDNDIEFLADVAEHVKAGGQVADLGSATVARTDATGATFGDNAAVP